MENSVIGVYDNYSQAQKAMNELLASGISRSNIQMNPEREPSAATTTTEHDTGHGIGHFFRSLFGMEDSDRTGDVYAEAVRRGSCVLVVDADDEQQREQVIEVMNRFDPVDIEERSMHWRSQGWTGYDESAPRMTDEEIQRDRSLYPSASRADITTRDTTMGLQGAMPDATADTTAQPDTTARTGTTEEARIPVVEEELRVGKREVQRGGVRVFQRVRETPVHESIELREEHVKVERHPVDQPASEADLAAIKEGAVEMREMAEEPVIEKAARVIEEVVVGKEVSQQKTDINDTVRRTDVEVEQLGARDTAGTPATTAPGMTAGTGTTADTGITEGTAAAESTRMTGDTATAAAGITAGAGLPAGDSGISADSGMTDDSDFRHHWQSAYGQTGGRYEDYDAAYRYGSTMAGTEQFRNYRWEDAEPQMRSDWERQHPESTWEKVKDAVRYGAERVTGHRPH